MMKRFLERSLLSNRLGLFLLNLLALVGAGATVYYTNHQLVTTIQQELQTRQTVETLQQTLMLVTDAETGQRGYGFTQQERFLEPYYAALASLDSNLTSLESRLAPDTEQHIRFKRLQSLIQQRLALLQQAIDWQQKKFELNSQIQLSEQGKNLHDQIRQAIAVMQDEEQAHYQQLAARAQTWSGISMASLLSGMGLSLLLFTLLYRRLNRQHTLQQEQSQTALALTDEKLRLALEAAHIGLWDWNLQTGEISWSKEHADLFGLAPAEFDGCYDTFHARVYPDDRAKLAEAVQTAIQTQTSYQHEYRVIWPDRSIHWMGACHLCDE